MKYIRDQKGAMLVFELVVLALVLLAGGYAYYQYNTNKNKVDQAITPKPHLTSPKPSATPKNNPYAGWDTYSSSAEGLSFKYPANWKATNIPCVNSTTQVQGQCFDVISPMTASSPYVIDVHYYWNHETAPDSENVFNIQPLTVLGSKEPLYVAATALSGASQNLVYNLKLVNSNYPVGKISSVPWAVPSQTQTGISFMMQAAMFTAQNPPQNPVGYTLSQYEAQPDYQNVIKIFESLSY